MAPPSVWTTPGVRGLVADVDDTVVVLLGPAVVVLVAVLVGEDVLELLDEDELDDDELLEWSMWCWSRRPPRPSGGTLAACAALGEGLPRIHPGSGHPSTLS